jgi:hypothetical protein
VNVEKAQFLGAAERVGVSSDKAAALWETLSGPAAARGGSFSVSNVAYYFGGFVIIGAMTFFMTEGWVNLGGAFICITAIVYAIVLAGLGWMLYRRENTQTPGGILVTAAVFMVPLAIFGFQDWHHLWLQGDPGSYGGYYYLIHGSWMWMELGTILASVIALRFVRFPLLTLPAAFGLWFLSIDGTHAIFGKYDDAVVMERVALAFGVAMIVLSILLDRWRAQSYAFWTYLFGAIALFGGMAILWSDEFHEAIFAVVCLFVMLLSIVLQRRVLIIFAVLGIATYLGHLAFDVFSDSVLFPFALTAIGLGIVAAGILYQRNEEKVRGALLALLPGARSG